ncbi:pyridoxal 5'-phosphate synthase glutaminase subunit PdxT [Desulfurococcus mucosus]|uniref:Pyridoxal 5'-phosphate synthase subunit PdxT n=1 Tax=Desulfurococcus mucosus (strain ATCC 35584 / DSM 2162 / JCM 9187 / O7/1) TaxID=765177 RepID=E8R8Q2_DESM0|nr:pyridoxal 5'-phosphate synthase glutaminase subunit PdxT [Desulfurococcus mucosus]ADV64878.1 pyridoxal phosphate synthase yaaE subunit [Desulfurococcus mucosus DSM 2162]
MVKVGVLALQGDYLEHYQLLRSLSGVEAVPVKHPRELEGVDALVIPGGESTTIGLLVRKKGLEEPLKQFAGEGKPILATCAGAILLAREVVDRTVGETGQYTLGLMDIAVVRNAYGRQRDSFIASVTLKDIGEVKAAFIRAPIIARAYGSAEIIGFLDDPTLGRHGVAARQGNMYAVTFHPEITGDIKLYKHIIQQAGR